MEGHALLATPKSRDCGTKAGSCPINFGADGAAPSSQAINFLRNRSNAACAVICLKVSRSFEKRNFRAIVF